MPLKPLDLFRSLPNPRHNFYICHRCLFSLRAPTVVSHQPRRTNHTQNFQTPSTTSEPDPIPLRKQLKAEARLAKESPKDDSRARRSRKKPTPEQLSRWHLTVGIEIHAELNTTCKLFSSAPTTSPFNPSDSGGDGPNTRTAPFDLALPGAQPVFQEGALVPAVRAAVALGCEVKRKSSWDRKHYFWWDQPNGYQITQYYEPFATSGTLTLHPHDLPLSSKHHSHNKSPHPIKINIKQIQLEQDTAKTILQPPSSYLLDFNRAGHPLIEIITQPEIHDAKTASAVVKKVQSMLQAVGANVVGMEMGGLRADVNVSIRRRDEPGTGGGEGGSIGDRERGGASFEYSDHKNLGQRTEIKNLSSFKSIEDAIIAERDRQILVLEDGGQIVGETRGFTPASAGEDQGTTRRLRGKEGSVDYRYMPDPDLSPVLIQSDLITQLTTTLPPLPDHSIALLLDSGVAPADAKTLATLDSGLRMRFFLDVVDLCTSHVKRDSEPEVYDKIWKTVGNWVLQEFPAHLSGSGMPFPYDNDLQTETGTEEVEAQSTEAKAPPLSATTLASLLLPLLRKEISHTAARRVLSLLPHPSTSTSTTSTPPATPVALSFEETRTRLDALIDTYNLRIRKPTSPTSSTSRIDNTKPPTGKKEAASETEKAQAAEEEEEKEEEEQPYTTLAQLIITENPHTAKKAREE
ncbi:MAG: hypothetical protein M1831_005988, partial [Alyxoria varia]